MDKEEHYSAAFNGLDYSLYQQQEQEHQLNNPNQHQQIIPSSTFCNSSSPLDKLSFADVMQFADFGPKLALNQTKINEDQETGIDPVYFLKFPVLNDKKEEQSLMEQEEVRFSDDNASVQNQENVENKNIPVPEVKNKRKRPRSIKTSEEVESQRMTHIAVERNRRKQMNEHLRVLRSLMPGSYVQRGDQASIIGGAIEFVRELEQLLQCLESQKRRRIYGEAAVATKPIGDSTVTMQQPDESPFFPPLQLPNDEMKLMEFETGLREETAESKSFLADVEVKVLGFDAMIKILSRRRPAQLIKTIAALEDLQLNILHTNITTIEQTVLYSFNVKIASECRFTAEEIASSVQEIFSFIHANSSM
ncbi:transcription factor FAMA isoform X2 [Mercurialis annua]|uniref:transcription factor FAMA isoform X2 n=1 Tax=Mercurialis annua TaxID=3986 RepID=UPI00215EF8C2|nr:transcription factor FAMA isoform X2 [Mercurialis annua]XP_050215713.1 transcription factor FAMA isoform X2 [Mercurialis annua]